MEDARIPHIWSALARIGTATNGVPGKKNTRGSARSVYHLKMIKEQGRCTHFGLFIPRKNAMVCCSCVASYGNIFKLGGSIQRFVFNRGIARCFEDDDE